MDENHWLSGSGEHRGELRAVAYWMLGSLSEADDAALGDLGGMMAAVTGP